MIIADYIDDGRAREGRRHEGRGGFATRDLESIADETTELARGAFSGDRLAAQELHRAIYRILLARHRPPSSRAMADLACPPIATFLWGVGGQWDSADRQRHRGTLAEMPAAEGYPGWIGGLLREHPSGVRHPLFDFLATSADYAQLREFFWQETPLDLYFADLIACLIPGIYGRPKAEIACNFWDEMGEGDPRRAHRTLRLRMMERLGLGEADHEERVDELLIEELELANAYFVSGAVRSYANQLIGMLLATESMAPGRLEQQLAGWRRVGLAEEDLEYLLVHTVIDVAHGEHWMDEVVRPIIARTPEAMSDITLGALRRLDIAERICDRMLVHLRSAAGAGAEVAGVSSSS